MAGITGIVAFNHSFRLGFEEAVFGRMMDALRLDGRQIGSSFRNDSVFCANALPLCTSNNNRLIVNRQLGIVCAVDGCIRIPEEQLNSICRTHDLTALTSEYDALPYIFKTYGNNTSQHIIGSYNLFCYSQQTQQALVTNDRFGFLPMYCYSDDRYFIFASKIECILASGLCRKIEFDRATIAEHLLFNYPLSDNSYIKQIRLLPNAACFTFGANSLAKEQYWSIGNDFTLSGLSDHDSFDLLDHSLSKAVDQTISHREQILNFSLTGGWDSRVVLSYLLPVFRQKLNCYSFGARASADITVPHEIAQRENLDYTPFVLDDGYLRDIFLPTAKQTIELSGGSRNFRRAHYLYAIKNMGTLSDTLITGIFGDQVLKVGRPQGGVVLSSKTIELLNHNFSHDFAFGEITRALSVLHPSFVDYEVIDELGSRIDDLKKKFQGYATLPEKYVAFRFEINLRKYFGNEASSYNDFVFCHSPFIDYNFVKAWLSTKYAGQRFDFSSSYLWNKQRSSALYTKLVMKHYPTLANYPTSRGFSMAETTSAKGWIKILHRKYCSKKEKPIGGFNTEGTEKEFKAMFENELGGSSDMFSLHNLKQGSNIEADALSLRYWMHYIEKKYL